MRIWLKRDLSAEVWKMAGPVVIGMISQTLMNVVDTAMVGRLGATALAAVGLGGIISWMILGSLGMLHIGVQSISARRLGEGKQVKAGQVLDNGLLIGLVVGALCSGWLAILISDLFHFATNDPLVAEAGRGYVFNRLLSGLPFMFIMAHRGFFNGVGHTRLHMTVAIVNNTLNVLFNYLLIFGAHGFPDLGAPGAGLATTIANCFGAGYFLILALKPSLRKQFGYYKLRNIEGSVIAGIVRLAVPSGLQTVLAMFGFSAFSAIVARIGTVEMAATNVVITIMSLSFLPGAGIGIAAASLVSKKLGEGDPDKAEAYGWESVRIGALVMSTLGVIFILIPEPILNVFTSDADIIRVGKLPLQIIGIVQAFDAAGMVLSQALQGAGMNRWVLYAEVSINWGFFIPATLLCAFTFGWGMIGAWAVMSVYFVVFGIIVTIKFAGGSWKTVKI